MSISHKALVIGANGLVGRRMTKVLTHSRIPWIGTYHSRAEVGLKPLNILNLSELLAFFLETKPTWVFFCANLSGGVNLCEKNPKLAKAFHETAIKNIAELTEQFNGQFIFLSTDYVFDGSQPEYIETDTYSPLNIYGQCKADAEEWLLKQTPRSLIIRTTNIYGWDPQTVTPNYMMQLIQALNQKKIFSTCAELYGHPTYVGSLVESIMELVKHEASGIYHIVGSDCIDRYQWSERACDIFGLNHDLVLRIALSQEVSHVMRPKRVRLSTKKFSSTFHTPLLSVEDGLKKMKQEMS